MLQFKKKPSFAQLWGACVYSFMYKIPNYLTDIKKIFSENNITKKSKILDSCAGVGFPAIELTKEGYNIDCMDASQDEISEFKKNARRQKVELNCKKLKWLEIPKSYKNSDYDFIFCRGNSFIYASGGWNKSNKVKRKESLMNYKKTLKIFYDLLKEDGVLYLDKFPDNEKPSKVKVDEVEIGNRKYDLIFYREMKKREGYRQAAMLLKDEKGKETGLPNVTSPLKFREIIRLMKEIGFKKIKKIKLASEEHFDILLAKK